MLRVRRCSVFGGTFVTPRTPTDLRNPLTRCVISSCLWGSYWAFKDLQLPCGHRGQTCGNHAALSISLQTIALQNSDVLRRSRRTHLCTWSIFSTFSSRLVRHRFKVDSRRHCYSPVLRATVQGVLLVSGLFSNSGMPAHLAGSPNALRDHATPCQDPRTPCGHPVLAAILVA